MFSIFLLVTLALLTWIVFRKKSPRTPPGPFGLPIVGYLPFLDRTNPAKCLNKLERKYGNLFSLKFGSRNAVVVGDFEQVKELFAKPEVSSRPELFAFSMFSQGIQRGVIVSSGTKWHTLRRFALRHMKDVGMVKNTMNDIITLEVEDMILNLKSKNGDPVNMTGVIIIPILNIIWNIIAGARMSHEDPEFLNIMKALCHSFEKMWDIMGISFLPNFLTSLIPGSLYDFDKIVSVDTWFKAYSHKLIHGLRETYDPNHMRHVIDYFFKEMEKPGSLEGSEVFTHEELIYLIADFFSAGAETTTTTIKYAILYLLHHTDIQLKIQDEIDHVIGNSRLPTLDDRGSLHYFEAFLNEVQRSADIVPLGVPHFVTSDVEIGKYIIPKDTLLISNLYSIHNDPRYWPNPEKFDPERFLENGKCIQNKDGFVPFSHGKRRCIGEPLAKAELFLILSGLLQKFNFRVCPGQLPPAITKRPGIVTHPDEYELVVVSRH